MAALSMITTSTNLGRDGKRTAAALCDATLTDSFVSSTAAAYRPFSDRIRYAMRPAPVRKQE
jgi:hypothetical protein